ncbi:malate:quinone oxidoreductase [Escherichia coli]
MPRKVAYCVLGTEVVSDRKGAIAALLGASPGASTAAPIMLDLLEKVFGDRVSSPQWQATLKAIVRLMDAS